MITKKDFILLWANNRDLESFDTFQRQLDEYVQQEIDKEFNSRDCE